uniref:type II toxin-antitoxin system VapC family toxin n=1 Tax=uncultured Sphingomonas sp. TaxID=158754 RepID=UPI0035CA54D7
MIVFDASAAVKLLFDESDSSFVRAWFRNIDEDLTAPDLLNVEVTQAVVRRVNARYVTKPHARATLREWGGFLNVGAITLRPLSVALVGAAAELAMNLGHPLADCVYLAAALDLGCDLATCDAKFHARAAPYRSRIRLLADFA